MNGPATNKAVITVITSTIAVLASAAVITICLMSFYSIQIPPELNTLAGGLVGSLAGMLVKTSPTETQVAPPHPPQPPPGAPAQVEVVNTPVNPVPTENQN